MGVKQSQAGEYIDLHRLIDAVIELRLQVACLENVLRDPHCELNISASPQTNVDERRPNGRRARHAGFTRRAHQMPHIPEPIPEGVTAKNINDLSDELEQKIRALGQ